jgi:hypothetical protein
MEQAHKYLLSRDYETLPENSQHTALWIEGELMRVEQAIIAEVNAFTELKPEFVIQLIEEQFDIGFDLGYAKGLIEND